MVKKPGAFNVSCIGESHIRNGIICQDYSGSWVSTADAGDIAIIAVADGHGAAAHSRSDRGARFAVDAAISCIQEFVLQKRKSLSNPDSDLAALEKSIIAAWHEKVNNDSDADPLNNDVCHDGDYISHYGTTLLAAAVTRFYWFAIQIGDGKCVIFNEKLHFCQPVPWDDRCFFNITTSLCDEEAASLFRHFYSEEFPIAIFLGSDGIDDSFPANNNGLHLGRFYTSVLKNFLTEGHEKGKTDLLNMLPLLTKKGSGDDVSIAGIVRRQ